MDAPAPPAIVLERPLPCADADKAEEQLRQSLAPALAPRGAWSVVARFSRNGGSLSVVGEITNEVDARVAHRVLTEAGHDCSSLARAVGVWAALVLDAEVERAAHAPAPLPPPAPEPPAPVDLVPREEKPAPERAVLLAHADGERTLEVGVSMFVMGGTGAGVLAGPAVFGVVEAGHGWFLRPAVFVGRTVEELSAQSGISATLVAARFDACGRIPGFYIEHHGIQLDFCGGAEGGFTRFDAPPDPSTVGSLASPYLALGPSLALRGELGSDLALVLRGVTDINVLQEDPFPHNSAEQVTPSLFVGRAELGLSWQLR